MFCICVLTFFLIQNTGGLENSVSARGGSFFWSTPENPERRFNVLNSINEEFISSFTIFFALLNISGRFIFSFAKKTFNFCSAFPFFATTS